MSSSSKTQPKHDRKAADWEWGIGTADLIRFRRVARGGNPLIARKGLLDHGWIAEDADDFLRLALAADE